MMKLLSLAVFAVAMATISSESAIRGLPGSSCSSSKHCTADNSDCYRHNPCWLGTCVCKKGFTLSQNTTADIDIGDCVEDKKLGGTCGWMQGGCVGNLYCDLAATAYPTGTCKCPYGTVADGDEWCSGTVPLHGICGTVDSVTFISDFSNWACTAYNEYYKDDREADYYYQSEVCSFDSVNGDYRCSCNGTYEETTANTTCQRMELASYGADCTSPKVCDPQIMGMFCNATSPTPYQCDCAWTLTPRNYNGKDGVIKQACVHQNAILEVEEGHECDTSDPNPANHMYCEWPLTCSTCPEDGTYGISLCMNGAAEMAVSLAVLGISLFSTKFL